MRHMVKGAAQRWAPKHPHKPSSQAIGARTIDRQHWREQAGTFTGVMPPTGGTYRIGNGPLLQAAGLTLNAADPAPPARMVILDEAVDIPPHVWDAYRDRLKDLPDVSFPIDLAPKPTDGAPPPHVHERDDEETRGG